MGRSLRIGSIWGVPLRLHWSFPLLGLLWVAAYASSGAGALVGGAIWIAAIFACIVVHELSHAFVARRRGFKVRDIVLLPFGGMSEIAGLPGTPADELAIAIAGPLASVALAGTFAALAALAGASLWPPEILVGPIAVRLLWANVLLAAFNLVPAIPMDGGRVLRALLARRSDDLQATITATRIGRALGVAMVVLGVMYQPWLAIIGVFVFLGAGGERQAAEVRSAVGGLRVVQVMVHDLTTLESSFPLSAVAPFLEASPGRVEPVVTSGRYVGLVAADRLPGPPGATRVADVALINAPTLAPDDLVYPTALEVLGPEGRSAAAVLDDGRVIGVVYRAHVEAAIRRATGALGRERVQG